MSFLAGRAGRAVSPRLLWKYGGRKHREEKPLDNREKISIHPDDVTILQWMGPNIAIPPLIATSAAWRHGPQEPCPPRGKLLWCHFFWEFGSLWNAVWKDCQYLEDRAVRQKSALERVTRQPSRSGRSVSSLDIFFWLVKVGARIKSHGRFGIHSVTHTGQFPSTVWNARYN